MPHKEIIEHHLPDAVNRVTGAGVSMWSASAAWTWLGVNQSSITSACAIIGVLITLYGVFRRPK